MCIQASCRLNLTLQSRKNIANFEETLSLMSPAYTTLVAALNQQNLVLADDIYDTDTVQRLTDVYELFYDFANTHLQGRRAALGFPPSYLFFRNDISVNAFARTRATYKMIGINYGCIETIYDLFEERAPRFEDPAYSSLHALAARIGNPMHVCFFQFFSLFLYYHEYAHLVQRAPLATFDIDELNGNPAVEQVLRSHAYELDADWYAASNAAMHMTQYFENEDGGFEGTEQEVADMISIGLAAILTYFIKSGGPFPVLYLAERSHPHPFVRLSYCAVFLLDTLAPNLPANFELNQATILNKSALLAQIMLTENNINPLIGFAAIFMQNHDAIENHINNIIEYAVGDPHLCRNRPADQV